jgi:hypothetical protein
MAAKEVRPLAYCRGLLAVRFGGAGRFQQAQSNALSGDPRKIPTASKIRAIKIAIGLGGFEVGYLGRRLDLAARWRGRAPAGARRMASRRTSSPA